MEASLLPSERTRLLAEKAVLVGVRKADPACETLRKEFDARATAWVVVLDARGELLDSGPADETGILKKKEMLGSFAGTFVDRVEKSLQRKESLQDFERRWEKDPRSEAAFDALISRLDEMKSYARIRERCTKAARLPGVGEQMRAGALLRGFAAAPREFGALGTPEARARYASEGEQLVAEHAAHPRAGEAAQSLFLGGYGGGFDLPAKSAAGIARLKEKAATLKDPGPLRERIEELVRIREKEIAALTAGRAAAKGSESSEAWYAGALGDAETTIRVFSKPPHDQSAYYQAWVREAREKLQRQGANPDREK